LKGGKKQTIPGIPKLASTNFLDPQAFLQPTPHPYHLLGLSLRPLLCFLLSLLKIISLRFLQRWENGTPPDAITIENLAGSAPLFAECLMAWAQ